MYRLEADEGVSVRQVARLASVLAGGALVALGIAKRSPWTIPGAVVGADLLYSGIRGHGHLYNFIGIGNTKWDGGAQTSVAYRHSIRVEHAMAVNKPVEDLYSFWRDFENLPKFMGHLETVCRIDDKRSHWTARGPAGMKAEWDAEIVNEVPNELIGWRSLEGSDVDNAGSVHFKPLPGERGTEVRVVLRYDPPGGRLGKSFAKLFGREPRQQVREDLRRFKQLMETGEISTTEYQPSGRLGGLWSRAGEWMSGRRRIA